MKCMLGILVLILLQSQSCNKPKSSGMPRCIQDKIEAIKKVARWNPPASVTRYLYKGKYVYAFSSNCCDQFNYVYDDQCNVICAPSGGITGKGDNKCPDFKQEATGEMVVWKDGRGD